MVENRQREWIRTASPTRRPLAVEGVAVEADGPAVEEAVPAGGARRAGARRVGARRRPPRRVVAMGGSSALQSWFAKGNGKLRLLSRMICAIGEIFGG
jgi:hypothetical protein